MNVNVKQVNYSDTTLSQNGHKVNVNVKQLNYLLLTGRLIKSA